jgi:hypothetical protein
VSRRGWLAALVLVLAAAPAAGEHELYYRYTVLGYVKDKAGQPQPGQSIELVRDKTGFSYLAETDATGLFIIVARLGDESAGERLTLSVGVQRLALVARFDPTNHTDERGTRVDAEGDKLLERATWFRSTLARLLAAPKP